MNLLGISDFGLFCLAVLLLNATPGPDTAYIVGRSVAQGRAAGLISALGISVGIVLHSFASALGLSAILAASATAYMAVKWVGGLYLAYLGLRMLLTRSRDRDQTAAQAATAGVRSHKKIFLQAVMINILNPKVVLFFLSFLPQFVRVDSQHKTVAFFLLGSTIALISLCWNSGTAFLAGSLTRRADNNPHIKRWLERGVGTAFVALGAKLVLTRN